MNRNEDTLYNDIKNIIREKRLELGLTYEELGKIVGVSKSTVRKWETGMIKNITKVNILALAKALNVSPALLIGWDITSTNEKKLHNPLSNNEKPLLDNEYKLIFSKNLKYYLQLNNKSQQDLVKDLGLSSSTVSNWYTGLKLPRMNKIEMLANYFGINKSDLLEDKSLNIKKNKNTLTKEEIELLENYNKLDNKDKCKIIDYVTLLSSQDKYKEEKNIINYI